MSDYNYIEIFGYMAQRDDAIEAGDDAGFNYWRGYIDAVADSDGLEEEDLAWAEAAYRRMQVEAAASMDAARERDAFERTRSSDGASSNGASE